MRAVVLLLYKSSHEIWSNCLYRMDGCYSVVCCVCRSLLLNAERISRSLRGWKFRLSPALHSGQCQRSHTRRWWHV